MEIIAETGSGINTPLYDSIALHNVAVRRIFSDDPGHRPPAGQEKRPFGGLPFRFGTSCFAPKVLLRAAPLSSFNFLHQHSTFFAPSQRLFHILFILVEDEQKFTVVLHFLMKLQCIFKAQRYFHRLQTGFLLIELPFSLPQAAKKRLRSARNGAAFRFTC